MRSFSPSSNGSGTLISLELAPGRLRHLQHALVLVLGLAGTWIWFGITGAIPFALWWLECCRPQRHLVVFSESDIRLVHLSRLRIHVKLSGGRRIEIFRDELSPGSFTALRRRLKSAVSAGGRLEDVEPV